MGHNGFNQGAYRGSEFHRWHKQNFSNVLFSSPKIALTPCSPAPT